MGNFVNFWFVIYRPPRCDYSRLRSLLPSRSSRNPSIVYDSSSCTPCVLTHPPTAMMCCHLPPWFHYWTRGLCLRPRAVGIGPIAVGIDLCRRLLSAYPRRRRCRQRSLV